MPVKSLPAEAVVDLRRRLSTLPFRSLERHQVIRESAATYDVSESTVYRALRERLYPRAAHRADRGTPRVLPQDQLERYCELIAAMKHRTTNRQVMRYLGVEVRTHLPQGHDGRRVTARAKGKVERPFRTVKEVQETLYHFHTPETEAEANAWLLQFLRRYNAMQHCLESHSRLEDWVQHLPPAGVRAMCSWERFCTFAREPER
jgi:hypothetical protein